MRQCDRADVVRTFAMRNLGIESGNGSMLQKWVRRVKAVAHVLVREAVVVGVPHADRVALVGDRLPTPEPVRNDAGAKGLRGHGGARVEVALGDGTAVARTTGGPGAAACYANCDASTVAPTLNVNDYICFNNKFAVGDPYANCDESTVSPVLNVNDFICFNNRFAAGCP